MAKAKISTLLEQKPSQPVIRRGDDFEFSAPTTLKSAAIEELQISRTAERQHSANPEQQKASHQAKSKVGWAIDTQLLRAIRISAVQQGKKDYEVVEEAMELYLGGTKNGL